MYNNNNKLVSNRTTHDKVYLFIPLFEKKSKSNNYLHKNPKFMNKNELTFPKMHNKLFA